MKNHLYFLLVLFLCSCSSNNQKGMIVFDTSKQYPEKEIYLQDICDVSYVVLDDSMVVTGRPRLVTDSYIIFTSPDKEFIFYDLKGRFVRKFGHRGQGPGEYPYIGKVIYDPYTDQLLVSHDNEILYYTMEGRFVRSISIDTQYFLWNIKNYNKEYLLCDNNRSLSSAYVFVSKETGEIKDSIDLKLKAKIDPAVSVKENGMTFVYSPSFHNLVKAREGFLLSQISADTFYILNDKKEMKPVFVRTPSVHDQPTPILVNAWIETELYYFLSTVEKKFDPQTEEGFAQAYFMIEKDGHETYFTTIFNKDIEGSKIQVDPEIIERTADARKGIIVLYAEELLDAYQKGKIKSPALIDIVKKLKEDSNPVIMLMRFESN